MIFRNRWDSSRVRTAYHEAAHAVADVRFGFQCKEVTIVSCKEAGISGQATSVDSGYYNDEREPGRNVSTLNVERAKSQLIVLLAGYAAALEKDPTSKSRRVKIRAADDIAEARSILHELGDNGTIAPWFRKALAFVRSNWRAIDMVARDLIEVKRLDGTEVDAIVGIADGEPDAKVELAQYRSARGLKGTRQFPFKIVQ